MRLMIMFIVNNGSVKFAISMSWVQIGYIFLCVVVVLMCSHMYSEMLILEPWFECERRCVKFEIYAGVPFVSSPRTEMLGHNHGH